MYFRTLYICPTIELLAIVKLTANQLELVGASVILLHTLVVTLGLALELIEVDNPNHGFDCHPTNCVLRDRQLLTIREDHLQEQIRKL